MEPQAFTHMAQGTISTSPESPISEICSVCHQPVRPEYYFCPNCGTKLKSVPLSTSISAQIGLYAFSIILPLICFIMVTKWKGVAYFKSSDPKAHQMGIIAWTLIVLSTILLIYLSYVWTVSYIQETVNSLNADMSFQ